MAAKKKCRAFKAERRCDENTVTTPDACAFKFIAVSFMEVDGDDSDVRVRRDVEILSVQGLDSPWLESKPRCRGGSGGESAGEHESGKCECGSELVLTSNIEMSAMISSHRYHHVPVL